MKHIKLFETATAFEAARATLDLPNVSLIEATNGINYLPYVSTPSHEYVEIGGVKWATMNIGANSITDYGLYFQWADTQGYTAEQVGNGEGQKHFEPNDYKYYDEQGGYTKYNENDGLITLLSEDDAVNAAWGGNWRMPTVSEFIALDEAVTIAWTADYQGSGVAGMICTDKNDTSKVLFFPACGGANYGSVYDVGNYGCYWSGSLSADYGDSDAYYLYFGNGVVNWDSSNSRCYGYHVRGILDE